MDTINISKKWDIKLTKITKLNPNPKNRNKHSKEQVERLAKLIDHYGWRLPIIVSNQSGLIVSGHGRLLAAKKLKLKEVPVSYQNFRKEDEERAFGISDNAIASWAELDMEGINLDLAELGPMDIDLLGIKNFEIEPADKYADKDADAIPDTKENESGVKEGDLWILGDHRVLCGDCTDPKNIERLMNGEKADMVFTDPPYNIGGHESMKSYSEIRPKSYGKLKKSEWDKEFNPSVVPGTIQSLLSEAASIYVCTSHHLMGFWWDWLDNWADFSGFCVWVKSNPMPSIHKRHWTWNCELIAYATRGKHVFNFPDSGHALSCWDIPKSPSNDLHPTQKPVAVPEHAIVHSSKPGMLVWDGFLGSGSTLIACEKTNRKCYGTEIDPHYCSVIIKRWEDFTGNKAMLDKPK